MDVKEMFLRRGFSTVEVRLIDGDSAYEVYVTGQSLTLQIDNLENERVAVLLKNKDKEIVGAINQRYVEFKNALKARDEEYLVWSRTDAKYKSSETKMD
jgi:molybdopterin converting factor small subunit